MDTGYEGLAKRATERKRASCKSLGYKLNHQITTEDICYILSSMNGYDVGRIQLDTVRLIDGKAVT
jgi:hypothetical protein